MLRRDVAGPRWGTVQPKCPRNPGRAAPDPVDTRARIRWLVVPEHTGLALAANLQHWGHDGSNGEASGLRLLRAPRKRDRDGPTSGRAGPRVPDRTIRRS